KLLQLTGKGDAQVTIRLAGDLNRDGAVDGTDSTLFEQALAAANGAPSPAGEGGGSGNQTGTPSNTTTASISPALPGATQPPGMAADLNGDGVLTAADRQLLYANYGWRANQAPLVQAGAGIRTPANGAPSPAGEGGGSGNGSGALPNTTN
ncbi:dockerin type I domain-containing protein, partial [Parachitinimonas caeni]